MKYAILSFLVSCCGKINFAQSANSGNSTMKKNVIITFSLDLGAEIKNVQSVSSIGIRGNTAPLSWNKSLPLTDDDKNGIYEATIKFETTDPALHLKFKYFHDSASWENGSDR